MRKNERCANCSEPMIRHTRELELHHPGYIRTKNHTYTGWYECTKCGRTYVPVVLKRFLPSHVRSIGP